MDDDSTRGERGSSLMLVPAGVLILILLATLSVDSAIAFAGQRELFDIAAAAAGDAAVLGIDEDRYYRCSDLVLDPARTNAAAEAAVARRAQSADIVTVASAGPVQIAVSEDGEAEQEVTVRLAGTVQPLIAGTGPRQVHAFATVAANVGELPGGPGAPPAPVGPPGAPGPVVSPAPPPGGPGPLDDPPPGLPVAADASLGTLQLPLPPQTTTPLVPVPDPSPPLESAPGQAPPSPQSC